MNNLTNNQSTIFMPMPTLYQIQLLTFIYSTGYLYIVPSICAAGFILNIFSIVTFYKLRKNGNIYIYFLIKTISDSVILLIGAFIPYGNCVICDSYQTLGAAIYGYFFLAFLTSVAAAFSGFCEISIAIDRILIIRNQQLKYFSCKIVLVSTFLLSIIIHVPLLFASYIKQTSYSKYKLLYTDFGLSLAYTYYLAALLISLYAFLFISIGISDFVLLIEFKKYVFRKNYLKSGGLNLNSNLKSRVNIIESTNSSNSNNTSNRTNENTHEVMHKGDSKKKLTKMVLILSILFMTTNLFQAIATILGNIDKFNNTQFNEISLIINFTSALFNYLVYAAGIFYHSYFNYAFFFCLKRVVCFWIK